MFRRPNRLIIPQYAPPREVSLVAAAELLGEGRRAIAAQLVDLAVQRVISISRSPGGRRRSGFTVTLVGDIRAQDPDERAILVTLFGGAATTGDSFTLKPGRNRELGERLRSPHRWITARLVDMGLAAEHSLFSKLLTPWRKQPVVPTPAAYPVIDHLWGLHDYIRLAEKDRIAYLQSPDGAERRTEPGELERLVLNEKLLGYAVLFGLEKQWMKELDLQYRELPAEFLVDAGDLLLLADLVVHGIDIADVLSSLVDAADVLDGVGAFFGGLGDVLGGLDFFDFG